MNVGGNGGGNDMFPAQKNGKIGVVTANVCQFLVWPDKRSVSYAAAHQAGEDGTIFDPFRLDNGSVMMVFPIFITYFFV